MANCAFLLNDGTSFILQNDGASHLLLNDNTCLASGEEGALGATGTATADFINGSFTTNPVPFQMTGTASVLFRSLFTPEPEPESHPTIGAGGAKAWSDRYRENTAEKQRRAMLLALIRSSDDYRRLKRKLAMLQEHLLDARGRVETVTVKEKIAEIERQIEMMERLE
jgi:predicted secreted protein